MTQQGHKSTTKRAGGPAAGRWMALDVGSRSIGVALSDPLRITTRPLRTLRRSSLEEDAALIAGLIRQHEAVLLVVGYPRHLDGRPAQTLSVIEPLARRIEQLSGLPLAWADERLSSKEAEQLMAEMGCSLSEMRSRRDEFAAALILRWYIDEGPGGADASPQGQERKAR